MTIIFAFVADESNRQGYYINNNVLESHWVNAPTGLSEALERTDPDDVLAVYGGIYGRYVLRTFYKIHTWRLSPRFEPSDLQLYASGGDGVAWWCKYRDGRIMWGGLHRTLDRKLNEVGHENIKSMSLGKEADNWVILNLPWRPFMV